MGDYYDVGVTNEYQYLYPYTYYSAPGSVSSDPRPDDEDDIEQLVKMGSRVLSPDIDHSSASSSVSEVNPDYPIEFYPSYFYPQLPIQPIAPAPLHILRNEQDDPLRITTSIKPDFHIKLESHVKLEPFELNLDNSDRVLSPVSPATIPVPKHITPREPELQTVTQFIEREDFTTTTTADSASGRRQGHNRNYRCRHCNMMFSDADSLKHHILLLPDTSVSQRPYKCPDVDCNWNVIGFHRNNDCSRHYRQVHGVREFVCRWQGTRECRTHRFVTAWLRNRHERTVHAEEIKRLGMEEEKLSRKKRKGKPRES